MGGASCLCSRALHWPLCRIVSPSSSGRSGAFARSRGGFGVTPGIAAGVCSGGKRLRIRRLEDWYQVSPQQFRKWDGGGLVAWFEKSPSAVLKDYRPHYPWLEWRFSQVPAGFWDERTNRARYLEWPGHQLGFRRIEDWYTISYDDITQRHGARSLAKFGDSPITIVRDYHPTYDWREWLFRRPPRQFWAHRQNRRRYLDWLGEQLGFAHPDDWQRLRAVVISSHRGQGLLKRFRY